jgi:hypothetical protein
VFGSKGFVICDEPARERDEQVSDPDNLHVGGAGVSRRRSELDGGSWTKKSSKRYYIESFTRFLGISQKMLSDLAARTRQTNC